MPILDKKMFLQLVIKELGLYSLFNGLRDALFNQLASQNRVPISNSELNNILLDATEISKNQMSLIKNEIPSPDGFRYYRCKFEFIYIHYFVNVSHKEYMEGYPVAKHLQEIIPIWSEEECCDEDAYISVIVLHENHPKRTNANYPMVIKHELVHAAIESLIEGDIDLMRFYFDEENEKFIEFLCDVVPYLSNSAKKENGINKYIDDSSLLFGYDAEEEMGEYIQLMVELEEQQKSPFVNTAEKYAFFLLDTEGSSRMRFLGVNRMMYNSATTAKRWKESIEAGLEDGDLSEDRKEGAKNVLNMLYQRMTE